MGNKSFTLIEPHLHGHIQIGPKSLSRGDDSDAADVDAKDTADAAASGPPPAAAIVVALLATAIAILLAKKLRGSNDSDET